MNEHPINIQRKAVQYECLLCKKCIGQIKSHLINHMCVHSGTKLFECQQCSKQSTQISNIILHDGLRSYR